MLPIENKVRLSLTSTPSLSGGWKLLEDRDCLLLDSLARETGIMSHSNRPARLKRCININRISSRPLYFTPHCFYFVPLWVRPISSFLSLCPDTLYHAIAPDTIIYGGKKFLFWSQENYVILLKFNFKTWNMTELNVST